MTSSTYYRKAAARRRGAAIACALCMTYAAAALSYALLLGMPLLAIACGISLILLAASGLRFLHLATVMEEKAGPAWDREPPGSQHGP